MCLEFDEAKVPRYTVTGKDNCAGCQHCMAVCPKGALSFGGLNPDDSDPVSYGKDDDLLGLIKSRRSVRAYKKDPIPEETMNKLVTMLAYPPRGENKDSLHISLVGSKEKMEEIVRVTYEEFEANPSAQHFIPWALEERKKGVEIVYRGAPSMAVVSVDLAKAVPGCETIDPVIALSYLELYAESLGLGTLWCDFAVLVANSFPKVKSLLNIPEGFTLNFILLIGVPAVRYKRVVQKKPNHVSLLK